MKSSEFTSKQRHDIELVLAEGLNVLVYAKKEYMAIQMHEGADAPIVVVADGT